MTAPFRAWSRDGERSRHRAHPAPRPGEVAWWHVMGYASGPPRTLAQVEQRFRTLVAVAHPDRGGSAERMHQLIRARAQARRQLTP